jgi:hypothetical protein
MDTGSWEIPQICCQVVCVTFYTPIEVIFELVKETEKISKVNLLLKQYDLFYHSYFHSLIHLSSCMEHLYHAWYCVRHCKYRDEVTSHT